MSVLFRHYFLGDYYYSDLRVVVLLDVFIFFFKQKTAYELRISDWSSDVCSSDLRPTLPLRSVLVATFFAALVRSFSTMVTMSPTLRGQIGRASCRERVCQYV